MSVRLRSVLLLTRDVAAATAFYSKALGLPTVAAVQDWALLQAGDAVSIQLQQVSDSEAPLSVGYSPVLQLATSDFDGKVPELLMAGATLDGAIKHTTAGKVAMMRAPLAVGGHMLSIVELEEDAEAGGTSAGPQPPLR